MAPDALVEILGTLHPGEVSDSEFALSSCDNDSSKVRFFSFVLRITFWVMEDLTFRVCLSCSVSIGPFIDANAGNCAIVDSAASGCVSS